MFLFWLKISAKNDDPVRYPVKSRMFLAGGNSSMSSIFAEEKFSLEEFSPIRKTQKIVIKARQKQKRIFCIIMIL